MYILAVIQRSISLFTRKQKISFAFLMIFFLFSALVQVLGIASVGPFIALLADSDSIQSNQLFLFFYNTFHFTSSKEFIIFIAFSSLFMMVFSNLVAVVTLWLLMRFSIVIGGEIQRQLFENLIFRPYLFHKSNNYTQSISVINQEAPRFVYMVMQPILLLFSNLFVALVILVGLIYLNPVIAILTGAILGFTYMITYLLLKRSLKKHGDVVTERNTATQKILSEGFVGIKEVKLNRLQKIFIEKFRKINMRGLHSTSFIVLSGDIPKFVIESVAFSAIFVIAIITLMAGADAKSIVPMLSVYAIAGYKLLPTMQQVYKSISSLSAHGSVPFSLSNELLAESHIDYRPLPSPLTEVNKIELVKLSFKYPTATRITLDDINVNFYYKMINTIAGHSGSGKSTLVDILLGLIHPDSGQIIIDGKVADSETIIKMQRSCGYVPQHIFILDDSVVANVAFGIAPEDVDEARVIEALKNASALEFVERLPQGIHSHLGQDGKLLSGGQRQKIGIARSLYRNPKILILDEPTSALDIESEYDFMMLLRSLKEQVLIIVISHRPSAIKCSDLITLIEDGRIESHGSFQELKETSPLFINMLEKSSFD